MASNDGRISSGRLETPLGAVYTETVLRSSYDFVLEHYLKGLPDTNP